MVSLLFVFSDLDQRTARILALMTQLEGAAARLREAEIECAKVLTEIAALDEMNMLGCASPGELGERVAIPAAEARDLFNFGRAMKAAPYVEDQVRRGRITVAAAACVGEVLSDPALQRPDDDWVGWAQTESTKAMRRRVQRRKEEARLAGEEALPLTVFVPQSVRDQFSQARVIASRKASGALTAGETFAVVVDHYLDTFDPDRVQPGDRKAAHTSMVAGRYVPAAVRREVYERQRGGCAVPFCDNLIFLEMAHLVPHACGGHREADNLVLMCSTHHAFFDLGLIRVRGTADAPQFFDDHGNDLARRFEGAFSPGTSDPRPTEAGPAPPSSPGAGPPAGGSPGDASAAPPRGRLATGPDPACPPQAPPKAPPKAPSEAPLRLPSDDESSRRQRDAMERLIQDEIHGADADGAGSCGRFPPCDPDRLHGDVGRPEGASVAEPGDQPRTDPGSRPGKDPAMAPSGDPRGQARRRRGRTGRGRVNERRGPPRTGPRRP